MQQHARHALGAADGMHRRHVLATAALAESYLPGQAGTRESDSDVGQACVVMRDVLPVLGSLTSTRALDAVSVVRRRLSAYGLPVARELDEDLRRCLAGQAQGS